MHREIVDASRRRNVRQPRARVCLTARARERRDDLTRDDRSSRRRRHARAKSHAHVVAARLRHRLRERGHDARAVERVERIEDGVAEDRARDVVETMGVERRERPRNAQRQTSADGGPAARERDGRNRERDERRRDAANRSADNPNLVPDDRETAPAPPSCAGHAASARTPAGAAMRASTRGPLSSTVAIVIASSARFAAERDLGRAVEVRVEQRDLRACAVERSPSRSDPRRRAS